MTFIIFPENDLGRKEGEENFLLFSSFHLLFAGKGKRRKNENAFSSRAKFMISYEWGMSRALKICHHNKYGVYVISFSGIFLASSFRTYLTFLLHKCSALAQCTSGR
jgi:hypothetical protein